MTVEKRTFTVVMSFLNKYEQFVNSGKNMLTGDIFYAIFMS